MNKRLEQFETLWINNTYVLIEEHNILIEILKEYASQAEEVQNQIAHKLDVLLKNTLESGRKIYLCSFMIDLTGKQEYALQLLKFARTEKDLLTENRYFLYQQLSVKRFLGRFASGIEDKVEEQLLLEEIVREYRNDLAEELCYIPAEERDREFVLFITEQFLGETHGPTKSALGRCAVLQNMGKRVLLINTAEQCTKIGAVPFFDTKGGSYFEDLSALSGVEWKGRITPFFQCDRNMPNIEVIQYLIETIKKQKPYYVIEIGGGGVLASLINDMIPVITVGMVPSAIGAGVTSYSTLGRAISDEDRKYLQMIGKSQNQILEHKFTSDLIEDDGCVTRQELGFSEEDFVIVLVGGRLDIEISEEFLGMLNRVNQKEKIRILVLGPFGRADEVRNAYPMLAEQIRFEGHVENVLAYLKICDLYVNPIRVGGGTSSVEAMSKGIPVVTTDYGDVAVNAGEVFFTENYETMEELLVRYKKDETFYGEQSEKALKRAEELLDTEKAFRELLEEFTKREGL